MTGPNGVPTFVEPKVGGGDNGEGVPFVSIRNLVGRVVAMTPTSFDPNATDPKGQPRPSVTATVVVLDGGPLEFGDNRQDGTPATHRVETPYETQGVISSHVNVVRSLSPHVGTGAVIIGRIQVGITSTPGNNKPFNLVPLDANDPARQLLAQYFGQRAAGLVTNPVPQPINGHANGFIKPAAPAAQVNYAPPVPVAAPVSPAPGLTAPSLPVPDGWNPAVWATLTPAQQSQFAVPTGSAAGY